SLAKLLAEAQRELEYGRGFVLLRGIPVEHYSDQEAGLLFRGIGAHIGNVVSQNAKGDLLGHVFDRGYADYRGRSDIRGYQTRAELESQPSVAGPSGFLRRAGRKEGGKTLLPSSAPIHNEMLTHEPLLLGL